MVVDGEHFDVSERASEPGVYNLRWVSGPNQDYGFASAKYAGDRQTDAELEDALCSFLSRVDPSTGYIE